MRNGDDYLQLASEAATKLHKLDEERAVVREELLNNILRATQHRKTQQQLADVCGYSRARIGQFLKEARSES